MAKREENNSADLGAMLVVAFFLIFGVYKLTKLLLKLGIEQRIRQRVDIENLALYWPRFQWVYLILRWASFFCMLVVTLTALIMFFESNRYSTAAKFFWVPSLTISWFVLVALAEFTYWVQQCFESPEIQRLIAGRNAEAAVRSIIEFDLKPRTSGQALHGALLVFDTGTPNEHSLELDHVLITNKNVFIIETKYKSGDVFVDEDAHEWVVETRHGEATMRNALMQVKRAAKTLRHHLGLEAAIPLVPVVVLVGVETRVINGPSNVLTIEGLTAFIESFEVATQKTLPVNKLDLVARIQQFSDQSVTAQRNHVARIQERAMKASAHSLRERASIE